MKLCKIYQEIPSHLETRKMKKLFLLEQERICKLELTWVEQVSTGLVRRIVIGRMNLKFAVKPLINMAKIKYLRKGIYKTGVLHMRKWKSIMINGKKLREFPESRIH